MEACFGQFEIERGPKRSALSRRPIIPLDGRKEFIGSVRRGLANSLPIGALRRNGPWKLVLDSSRRQQSCRSALCAEFERDSSSSKETVRVRKRTQGLAFSRRPIIPLDGRKKFSSSSKETLEFEKGPKGRRPINPVERDYRKHTTREGCPLGRACFGQFESAAKLPIGAMRRVRKRQFEFERGPNGRPF